MLAAAEASRVEPGPALRAPAAPAVPVVASLPHGGRWYPPELTTALLISPDILWCDWLTRELYDFLPGLGIASVSTGLSRFVADVNRDPGGTQHGRFWSSVVAAQTPNGRRLYWRPLSPGEIRYRISLAHEPFHAALEAAIGGLAGQFGRVLLLDLHSFRADLEPDVILGDRGGLTAAEPVMALVAGALGGQGFRVVRNQRFSGGWTVRRFAGRALVDAVQIELNQRSYLNFTGHVYPAPPPPGDFGGVQQRLAAALREITSGYAALAAGHQTEG